MTNGKGLCNFFIFLLIVIEALSLIWVEVGDKDTDVEYRVYLMVGSGNCILPKFLFPVLFIDPESKHSRAVWISENGA